MTMRRQLFFTADGRVEFCTQGDYVPAVLDRDLMMPLGVFSRDWRSLVFDGSFILYPCIDCDEFALEPVTDTRTERTKYAPTDFRCTACGSWWRLQVEPN